MSNERVCPVALSELTRWGRNYRLGDVPAIIASITRFGFNGALRVWRKKHVMAGNHALVALQTMKANGAAAPVGIEVREDGEWLVPCIEVSHLNKREAEAFAAADNRTQELGKNDPEALSSLLKDLAKDAPLMEATGYTMADLDKLLAQVEAPPFEPVGAETQPELGQPRQCTCPECGHVFEL
jgi:hypothetical protein